MAHCPDSSVIVTLIQILESTENEKYSTDLASRRRVIHLLEDVGVSIEQDLPVCLRTGDYLTDTWFSDVASKMAANFRGYKKWILTPRTDTHREFIRRIGENLVIVASGRWNELELIVAERVTTRRKIFERVVSLGRVAITALLAPVLFWGLQRTEFALKGPTAEYATIVAVLWFLVTLLGVLDPFFGAKIAAIKDLAQALPWVGRKESK